MHGLWSPLNGCWLTYLNRSPYGCKETRQQTQNLTSCGSLLLHTAHSIVLVHSCWMHQMQLKHPPTCITHLKVIRTHTQQVFCTRFLWPILMNFSAIVIQRSWKGAILFDVVSSLLFFFFYIPESLPVWSHQVAVLESIRPMSSCCH